MIHLTKGLIWAVFIHAIFGTTTWLQNAGVNYLMPFIVNFANHSYYDHYHVALTSEGRAWLWSSIVAVQNLGSLVAALFLAFSLDTLGRKTTYMQIRNVLILGALLLSGLSEPFDSFEMYMAGQFLGGLAYGLAAAAAIYVIECSPDAYRGLTTLFVSCGEIVWTIIALPFCLPSLAGNPDSWPYFYLIPVLPVILHLLCSRVLHDSPKYLFINKRDEGQAIRSVRFYQGWELDIDDTLAHFEREASQAAENISFRQIWQSQRLRKSFLFCLASVIAPELAGTSVRMQYSFALLYMVEFKPDTIIHVLLIASAVNLAGRIVVSAFAVEKWGRRPLYLTSFVASILAMGLMFVADLTDTDEEGRPVIATVAAIGSLLLTVFTSMLGGRGFAWLLVGEFSPQGSRAKNAQASSVLQALVVTILTLAFPPLHHAIGAWSFLIFTVLGASMLYWLWKHLPETRLRRIEDIIIGFGEAEEEAEEEEAADYRPLITRKLTDKEGLF